MNNANDPLEKLFVSESQPVDKRELAVLLYPYVSINKETKAFDFSGVFMELSNVEKILIVLGAVKARSIGLDMEDHIAPSEIIKMKIAPSGSVKSTLKNLVDSNYIRSYKGKYSLPNYKLAQVSARFNKSEK